MELLQQGVGLGIGIGIQHLPRMTVAGQKPLQRQDAVMQGRPDDHRPAGAALDQGDPAQDQGAHDPLPQLGLCDEQGAQPRRGDDHRFHGALGMGIHQHGAPAQGRELTHERARAIADDRLAPAGLVVLADRDLARQDQDHARAELADREQRIAGGVGPGLAERPQALDLLRGQAREHLIGAGIEEAADGGAHGPPLKVAAGAVWTCRPLVGRIA